MVRDPGVSRSVSSLRITYTGKHDRTCTQTVAIYRWVGDDWVVLDNRQAGSAETTILDLPATGSLAGYVGGSGADPLGAIRFYGEHVLPQLR